MKTPKAINEGELKLGELTIPVAVLEDGTRLLTTKGFLTALNRPWKGSYKKSELPNFIDAPNLREYIKPDLLEVLEPVTFINATGHSVSGYKAELLPLVCYVYLDAEKDKALRPLQKKVAKQSEILLRSLAKVGIVALIDEATGYQHDRERDALQKIFGLYLAKELLEWQKTFPDEFYQEIFRLNHWDYTVGGINKRPQIIGKWTNELIYNRLPKGVLEELKKKTPKSPSGNYTARFFQFLTLDIGNPHLKNVLIETITLMRVSDNWIGFKRNLMKLLGQKELDFGVSNEIKPLPPKQKPKTKFDAQLHGLLAVGKPPKE